MTSFLTPQFFSIYPILFVATIIQGGIGFGFAMVAAPLIMLIQPQLIPGPLMVAALFINLIMSFFDRQSTDYKTVIWLLLGYFPGLMLGGFLLILFTPRQTALLFGFLVLLAVTLSLCGFKLTISRKTLIPAGMLSSLMNITTTMGGPPVALVLQNLPGQSLRTTLALFFSIGNIATLISLASIQRFDWISMIKGILLLPPILLGLWMARYFIPWLDKGKTRQAVLILAAVSGLMVIWQQF